jgi:predicted alpha/beta hydrolase family esterase
MTAVWIIHGTMSSPQANWFPWLKAQLAGRGIDCHIPQLPTPDGQNLQNWLGVLNSTLPKDDNLILIGHSIGAACALHYAAQARHKLAGLFLLCPFVDPMGNEYDAYCQSFYDPKPDWSAITSCINNIVVMAGDNDPYVPPHLSRLFADQLGVEPIIIPGGAHLNADAGFTEFPQLLNEISAIWQ